MRAPWIALLFLSLLSGCSDPLTDVVNAKWPPVSVEQQRQAAIDTSAAALTRLTAPNIAVAINLYDAVRALNTRDLRGNGITALRFIGEEQLLQVSASFDRSFTADDAGGDENLRSIIAKFNPRIVGTITLYAGITGAVVGDNRPVPELEIRLLPALHTVKVDKIVLSGRVDATVVGEMIALLLNKYSDNISGELSRSSFAKVTIPALAPAPIKLAQNFKISNADVTASVEVQAQPAIAPVRLSGIAWSITDDQITAVVQLTPRSQAEPTPQVDVQRTFIAVRDQISDLIEERFGLTDGDLINFVGIRKDLMALTLNEISSQSNICIATKAQSSEQKTSTKIDLPDGAGIDCSDSRDCTPNRDCHFEPNVDRRDCDACLLSRPRVCSPRLCAWGRCIGGGCSGGGCIQRGRDPVCALAQGAQNDLYRLEAVGKKLDCERLKAQEKLACEAEKAGKKLLCEAGKEVLNRIAATGNFANLDVTSQLSTDGLRVCLKDFKLSNSWDDVRFALDVNGKASANLDINFVPLDIVGHLTCQFPWSETQRFTASLRESRLNIASKVGWAVANESVRLNFAVDEIPVKARLSPGPTQFLLTSTNMRLSCAGLNLLSPIVVLLTPFIPELRGEFDNKVPAQTVSTDLPLPVQKLGDLKMQLRARDNPSAFVVVGVVVP